MAGQPGARGRYRRYCNDASDALGSKWRQRILNAIEVLRQVQPIAAENDRPEDAAHMKQAGLALADFVAEQDARVV